MEFILLILSSLVTIISMRLKNYKRSLLSIFSLLWFTIFFLYSFRLFGLYDCKDNTFLMYIIGILSFTFGYIIVSSDKQNIHIKTSPELKEGKLRDYILVVLSIVSVFVFVKKSILAIPYWLAGGAGDVKRAILMEDALNAGSLLEILYTFVCKPIQIIMVIYAVVIIMGGLKQKYIVYLALGLTIFGYLCSGSKFAIVEVVIMTFAYFWLFTKLNFKALIKRYKALVAGVFLIMILISILLSMKGEGFGQSFYSYLCGCMPCSDNAINYLLYDKDFYGLFSFNGALRALNLIPRYLGIGPDFKFVLDLVWEEIIRFESPTYIASDIRYNAFVSMFTFFYADGGYWGVFLLSMLFGVSCSLSLRYAYKNPNVRSCSIVLFLALLICQSMVRFQLAYAPNAMALIYIMVLLPKHKIKLFI